MGRFIYRAFLLYLSLLYKLPQSHLLIKCFLFNIYILIDASESNLGFSIFLKDILAASIQNTAPAFQLLDVLLYFLSYSRGFVFLNHTAPFQKDLLCMCFLVT